MDVSEDRQKLYSGFSDALARAVELVAVPLLFALFGRLVDGWLGTGKVATVGLAVFAVVGVFVKAYYSYAAAMDAEDAKSPWRKV